MKSKLVTVAVLCVCASSLLMCNVSEFSFSVDFPKQHVSELRACLGLLIHVLLYTILKFQVFLLFYGQEQRKEACYYFFAAALVVLRKTLICFFVNSSGATWCHERVLALLLPSAPAV